MPRRIFTYQEGLGYDDLNMVVTIGAFVLGIGILLTMLNIARSLHSDEKAGANPWNSDGLEWSTSSPPESYAYAHIPVIASRHPLWDDVDEFYDPDNERTLERGRLTPVTTWLEAIPVGIATIPEDSLLPLGASCLLFAFFVSFVFQHLWIALFVLMLTFVCGCVWMWPHTEKEIV